MRTVSVVVQAPVTVVFDYLADPRNRPAWQSSLRSVELLDEDPLRAGARWLDRTAAGLVPEMTVTVFERPLRWAEVGRWRGVEAVLELAFHPVAAGTRVDAGFGLTGRGLWALPARVAGALATPAVGSDLRRAARLLRAR